jgi:hypothetical protein
MALHTYPISPLETVGAAGVGLDAHNPGTLGSAFQIHQENTHEAQVGIVSYRRRLFLLPRIPPHQHSQLLLILPSMDVCDERRLH